MNEKSDTHDQGLNTTTNGPPDQQEIRLRELTAENERLKAEVARTRIERDDYLKALYKLAPEYMFTAEEIQDMIANLGSGRVFMEEIQKTLTEAS